MRNARLLLIGMCAAGCGGGNSETQPVSDENYEIVYTNDGAVQCETPGLSEKETEKVLIHKGIDVISSGCAYISGIEVAAQCGLGDNNINVHTVHAQSLPDAQELGFESVATLKRGDNPGYVEIQCPE